MSRIATWCVLGACTTLAACLNSGGGGGGGTGPITFTPIAAEFDGYPAMGSTIGVAIPVLSANLDGISATDARITFNADSFTITLPGSAPVTVTDADAQGPSETHINLLTTHTSYQIGTTIAVEVHLGEETGGRDLFLLASVDDSTGTVSPSPMTYLVFGDETATLPTGTATYTGGFTATVFDASGDYVAERGGTTSFNANFGTGAVDLAMTVVGEGGGEVYGGTGTITSGARYAGTITSTGTPTAFSGDFNGAFFGSDADGTAGTFNATNVGATEEIIGGYTGFKD